jgi:hypothetical protein
MGDWRMEEYLRTSSVMDIASAFAAALPLFLLLNTFLQKVRKSFDEKREQKHRKDAEEIVKAALDDADAMPSPVTVLDLYMMIKYQIIEPLKEGEKSKIVDRWILPCFWTLVGVAIPIALTHFGVKLG